MAADNDDDFQAWVLPDFEDHQSSEKDEKDLFGRTANWYNDSKKEELDLEDEKPQPLTLEDIEKIRSSAYEDGFNEGKEAGFTQGLEEGKRQGLKEGHQEGLAQGLAEGLAEGQVKIDVQTLHWQQLISRLHRPLEKLNESVEFQLVKLATTLAEQITRCEVTVNPQVVLQALKQAIEVLPANEQTLIISFHPEDLIFIQNAFSESECQKRGWDCRSEPTLLRGDCQLHTQISSIDYTFSTRIEQVLTHFLKENYQHSPEVDDGGDINNDQALNYQIKTESDLQASVESEANNEVDEQQGEAKLEQEQSVESNTQGAGN